MSGKLYMQAYRKIRYLRTTKHLAKQLIKVYQRQAVDNEEGTLLYRIPIQLQTELSLNNKPRLLNQQLKASLQHKLLMKVINNIAIKRLQLKVAKSLQVFLKRSIIMLSQRPQKERS